LAPLQRSRIGGHRGLVQVQFGAAGAAAAGEECRSQKLFHETDSADFHFQVTLSGTGLVLSIFEYTGISRKNAK
jgi:hypothetical protein